MKKVTTFFELLLIAGTLFALFITAGCSDDDDEEPVQEYDMVGFWTVSEIEIFEISVGQQSLTDYFMNVAGMSQEDAATAYGFLETMVKISITGTIDIREDKTYTSILAGEVEDGTWSQSADGKTFTIFDNTDDEFVATINTLTESMANISFIYDTNQDVDMNPATPDVRLSIEGEITLSR